MKLVPKLSHQGGRWRMSITVCLVSCNTFTKLRNKMYLIKFSFILPWQTPVWSSLKPTWHLQWYDPPVLTHVPLPQIPLLNVHSSISENKRCYFQTVVSFEGHDKVFSSIFSSNVSSMLIVRKIANRFLKPNNLELLTNMTTATAKTRPQINDLIGWMRKNNRAARAGTHFGAFFWRILPNDDVNVILSF